MRFPDDLRDGIKKYKVTFVAKKDSWLMKLAGKALDKFGVNHYFMEAFWTTLPKLPFWWTGIRVYYPVWVTHPEKAAYWPILRHEILGHGPQYGFWGSIKSLFLLLARWPARYRGEWYLASGVWYLEREPYLMDIKNARLTVTEAVKVLTRGYGKPAPERLMEEWFRKELEK